jgi:hypothetical protein
MENPYVREGREGLIGRADTRPIICRWQRENSGKMMNSLTASPLACAVDKALTRPYLCAVGSAAEALILSIVFGR